MEPELTLLEGGADIAALLLKQYDRGTATWRTAKEGEFWDAVEMAHAFGRFGEGRTIAVIDSGFDVTIPALAAQSTEHAVAPGASTEHGSVVALLVLEVAPRARILLYAVSEAGKLRSERVTTAIEMAVVEGADIICLSMGAGLIWKDVVKLGGAHSNPDYSPNKIETDDWRILFDIPATAVGNAARAAVDCGVTVVASAGNHKDYVFVPAAVPGVVSVGFHTVQRRLDEEGLMEEAYSAAPSFSQTIGTDIMVIQPAQILGSSFACPLIAGFAAVMQKHQELWTFLVCGRRAANASDMMKTIRQGAEPSDKTVLLVDRLFKGALTSAPHAHHEELGGECPECSFFVAPLFIDFGLFTSNTGNPEVAFVLLSAARRFAPRNSYAAANLGVVAAILAHKAKEAADIETAKALLTQAVENMSDAVRLRPGYIAYDKRLAEFRAAEADPTTWTIET